jgi:thiol-disulfide isomerase/thioredoxin
LPDNYISSFTKFLTQYDSVISPNLQLLEIFRILKNAFESENNSSNNHCKSFGYVTRLKEVFNNYIAQAYILYDLKSSIEKNNPCWNQVSQHLTSTIYYEKNKEKVDSILFINTHVSSKSNIALFKLIDLNKKNIDFQQLLLLKKKKLYLLDFWATWCVPCKKEDEILNSKTKSISSQIGVIKISLDDDKNIDLWKKMANKDGFHFKAVGGFENEFCKYFKITEIPRYMLVNSSGELIDENFYRPSDTLFIKYLNASVK